MRRALDVGIVGAGPAGLALALYLQRDGHRPVLFERFDAARPVGSGLILQPTGQAVLQDLGLWDAILALGAPLDALSGRDAQSGREVLAVRYADGRTGARGLGLHRAALFGVLHQAVLEAGIEIVTGCTVTGRAEGKLLTIASGEPGPFDLVVDASGARSLLRGGERLGPEPRPLAFGALWGTTAWIEDGFDRRALQQRYRRASIMAGVLPIGRTSQSGAELAAIFWSLKPDGIETLHRRGLEAWKADVLSVWPEMAPHLAQLADWDALSLARYGHHALRRPAAEGFALVGDAAHSASPQLGQGANMALLDARALLLALRESDSVADALDRYVRLRSAHVRLYGLLSAWLTPFYQSDSLLLPILRDVLIASAARVPPTPRLLTALVSGTLLDPLERLGLSVPVWGDQPGTPPPK